MVVAGNPDQMNVAGPEELELDKEAADLIEQKKAELYDALLKEDKETARNTATAGKFFGKFAKTFLKRPHVSISP
eukprot:gene19830-23716_t